jgi:hypothetical protein
MVRIIAMALTGNVSIQFRCRKFLEIFAGMSLGKRWMQTGGPVEWALPPSGSLPTRRRDKVSLFRGADRRLTDWYTSPVPLVSTSAYRLRRHFSRCDSLLVLSNSTSAGGKR